MEVLVVKLRNKPVILHCRPQGLLPHGQQISLYRLSSLNSNSRPQGLLPHAPAFTRHFAVHKGEKQDAHST